MTKPRSNGLLSISDHLYRRLLILYPRALRREFGADMVQVFRDSCRDAYTYRGATGVLEMWFHILGDVTSVAMHERWPRFYKGRMSSGRPVHGPVGGPSPIVTKGAAMSDRRTLAEGIGQLLRRSPWQAKQRCECGPWSRAVTPRAKRVLWYAQNEAHQLNHPYVGTEHLLLALMRDQEGIAGKVLGEFGYTLTATRWAVEAMVGCGADAVARPSMEMTRRAHAVIKRALEEGNRLNHNYIGTEHLLLGLMQTGGGVAADVLDELGANRKQLRRAVLRALSECE